MRLFVVSKIHQFRKMTGNVTLHSFSSSYMLWGLQALTALAASEHCLETASVH